MVESDVLGRDIERAVATGRDNAAVRADVEGWCEHLHVETLGVSMVGQMMEVPIGPHRLSCQYANCSTESVVLRRLFERFLIDNCAGCPHHVQGPKPHLGETILAEAAQKAFAAQQAAQRRYAQIENLRAELVQMAQQRAAAAQTEVASLFKLTVELFSDSDNDSTQLLCEATALAPQFFEDKVVELLELGASDVAFAAKCLPVLAGIARKNAGVRERARPSILRAGELGLPIEVIADALDACLEADASVIADNVIETLLDSQNYQRPIGGWDTGSEPSYPRALHLLVRLIDLDESRIFRLLGLRLQASRKRARANTCRVVEELSRVRPNFGLRMLPALIRSLELSDDIFEGVSADGSAINAICEIIVAEWAGGQEVLKREMPNLSVEAQAMLVDVYERFFRRGQNWRGQIPTELAPEIIDAALDHCMKLLTDAREEPRLRRAAAEAVLAACRADVNAPTILFDQLLGCLALIAEAGAPPAPTPKIILPGQDQVYEQEEMLRRQNRGFEWDRLKHALTEVIEEIGKRQPREVGEVLVATIDSAANANQKSLVLIALDLLGKVASNDPAVCLIALPSLMTRLMDYSSPATRATAISALHDAFRHSDVTLPSNVVDMLLLHLQDSYVVVHKAAVYVFRFCWVPLTDAQRNQAFIGLYHIWNVYAQSPNEMYFMHEIADALLVVANDNEEMRHVALRMIGEYLPTTQELVDSELCESLLENATTTGPTAVHVAKALI
jgi:hypothetical protein